MAEIPPSPHRRPIPPPVPTPSAPAAPPRPAPAGIPIIHEQPARWPVVAIGITKLLKSSALLALGIGVHHLLRAGARQELTDFVAQAHGDPHNKYLYLALTKILAIPEHTLRVLRVGFDVYAGLYAIEGVGLLADRPWAEWMVVVTTGGFVPLELYELTFHPTWVRAGMLLLNLIILAYLCFRLYRRHQLKREREEMAGSL